MAAAGARKRASDTPAPDLKVIAGGAGANSTLTDVEEQALFFQHKARYQKMLGAKKEADAALLKCGKLAKAELGTHAVDLIKDALKLGDPDGQARMKEHMERQYRVARWMGMPLGSQTDLFGPDRRTGEEVAFSLGFEHGSAGESRKLPERYAPSSPEGQSYFKGWDKGQEAIFNIGEKRGPEVLRGGASKGQQQPEPEEQDGDEGEDGDEADSVH